ncbi:BON domain-containing protein [Arenibaculum pallidiluteum]|uniref:BON domain-containing protein n=1 Tax=Arenibaculum pallidiluteum TaxID=2812559 RepID=UPI001A96C224|nr:BON domain-containing protein [Arenibaculum pallidiluteum]
MVMRIGQMRTMLAALAIVVSATGCTAISGRQTPGEYADDAVVSTKVRAALVDELGLKDIGVETMQNVVQLSGFVDSAQTKVRAGEIAKRTSGVKEVRNSIIVR